MAVPAGTYRVRHTFQLGTDATEVAVWGFHLRNADPVSQSTTDQLALHADNALISHWTGHMDKFSTGVIYRSTDVYALDSAGKSLFRGTVAHPTSGTGSLVGSGTTSLPWECAPVVSLYGYTHGSFVSQAGRKRGRVYLPPPATTILSSNQGIISNTYVDEIRTFVQAQLEQVNDIPSGLSQQARVVILSKIGGFNTDVVDVVCTSEVHSQRRRERQQTINYTSTGTLTP